MSGVARTVKENAFAGKQFGYLTTLYPLVRTRRSLGGWWLCKCGCGKEREVLYSDLTAGRAKSCGCQKGGSNFKIENLLGREFGRLTVIRYLGLAKQRGAKWLVRCSCGREIISRAQQLKSGDVKSCGCLRDEMQKARLKNLVGKNFGRLTVLGVAGKDEKTGRSRWAVRCTCGRETTVANSNLQSGHVKSCGCLGNEPQMHDLTGRVFARLTVLKFAGRDNTGKPKWLARCRCGQEIVARALQMKSGSIQSCGCLMADIIKEKKIASVKRKLARCLDDLARLEDTS